MAQDEGPQDKRAAEVRRKIMAARGELHDGSEKDAKGDANEKMAQEEWDRLTPEERLARNVTHGSGRYCRFQGAAFPAKLMPGQSGVIRVSAILQGQAVLPSPAPLEFVGQTQQGPVMLGSLVLRPAGLGSLHAAYMGRPVYDNTATFEVPVTMAADAEVGKQQSVAVDVRFDLYDGVSAQPIGRFIERTSVPIEVGQALDPDVIGGMPKPRVEVPATGGNPAPTETPAAPQPARTIEANTVLPEPAAPTPKVEAKSPSLPTAPPVGAGDDGPPMMMMIGGGALLLVVILLLARRK